MNSLPPGYALVSTFRVRRWLMHLSSILILILAQASGIGMVLLRANIFETDVTLNVMPWGIAVCVGVPLLLVVHELIHAATALSLGVPRESIKFGFGGLGVHCQIRHELPIGSNRKVFVAPLLVTAMATAVWTIAAGSLLASTLFAFALSFATSDVVMVWKLRNQDPSHVVGMTSDRKEFVILRRVGGRDGDP